MTGRPIARTLRGYQAPLTMYPTLERGRSELRSDGLAASIRRTQRVPGARVDGMANICKLSINVVRYNRPKMLTGRSQNGKAAGAGAAQSPAMGKGVSSPRCRRTERA